ncbi:hypothetical protein [Legionella sp. km772]|uniref:hypothetical protein n=1 Tax=Legionella sp. km772 TaxID=2498111 RepID=UPI0013154610|nr:hypothetical protein [Legionella sp. km772]
MSELEQTVKNLQFQKTISFYKGLPGFPGFNPLLFQVGTKPFTPSKEKDATPSYPEHTM